jgi:hypothetical protein
MGPDGGLTPGPTDQLTVGRKITLTLSISEYSTIQYTRHRKYKSLKLGGGLVYDSSSV